MIPSSPDGDDISRLIQEYNSMDPALRSDLLDSMGLTPEGWKSICAAHERRRRDASPAQSSTNAARAEAGSMSEGDGGKSFGRESVEVVFQLSGATKRVEVLLDTGEDAGDRRSWRSAPPPRGFGAVGPGRRRSGGRRRPGGRGRSDASRITIIIRLSEN